MTTIYIYGSVEIVLDYIRSTDLLYYYDVMHNL